jgi:DNA-binding response OmpR family regulator
MRLLLVEDDEAICRQVADLFRKEQFVVDTESDGVAGLEAAISKSYALAILDVMLPGKDGWSVCRELRQRKITTPILMLTARDSVDDRVKGLEEGADDYLPKPFDARELLARVRALLRRDKVQKTGVFEVADLRIDSNSRRAWRGERELSLTPREYSLLEALARNEGRTLTREVILESVWDNEDATENTVNFHVMSLRRKIDSEEPVKLIHTVHGFGYALRRPEAPHA